MQQEKEITTPHDLVFIRSMQDLTIAKDFFDQHMPEAIKAVADLDTLAMSSEMLIDKKLKKLIPDVVYTVEMGDQGAYLYPLLEHLSSAKEICVAVFKKKIQLMLRHCEAYRTKLFPLVHVIVIYHGDKKYPYSTEICDHIDAPRSLSQDNLQSQLQLIDLNLIPDARLRQHYKAGALQYTLKHSRDGDITETLGDCADWLADLEPENSNFVEGLLHYMAAVGRIHDPVAFNELVYQKIPQMGKTMTTMFEYMEQKGLQEGLRDGLQQGETIGFGKGQNSANLKLAKRLLARKNLPIEEIADLTDLDLTAIRALETED